MAMTVSRLGVAECCRIPVDGGYMARAGWPEGGASAGPRPRTGWV